MKKEGLVREVVVGLYYRLLLRVLDFILRKDIRGFWIMGDNDCI